MPWSLDRRDGRWCVIKDSDGSTAGCHDSRADAIKQQRALYAQESRVAAMYAELDAIEVPPEEVEIVEEKRGSELVKIEIGKEHDALIASLSDRMEAMAIREQETQLALVAALQQIGLREPVVNVEAPNVSVEPPAITVEQPSITVEQPAITPEIRVEAPSVSVNPQLVMPSMPTKKTVVFDRDYDGRLNSAEITEE